MPLQTKLLRWFEKNARPLPWRQHYRPYEVWVSEIMLQQTQMDTVLPYFDRWMKELPSIESLAQANESKVLKLWEGLGYYSRARNLHAGAKEIIQKFGGQFPSDFNSILSLKGIGRYTAGAISSIAFNQPRPIVDGNIFRVLSRVYAIQKSIDLPKNREEFWALEEKLIPKGRAREFNQALMELGALVCAPKNPACGICPLKKDCKAQSAGNPEEYPVRAARKKSVRVTAVALAVKHDGGYLLVKRPLGKIMGGLWEFPEWKVKDKLVDEKTIAGRAHREFGIVVSGLKKIGQIKRNYTHHLEMMHIFSVTAASKKVSIEPGWKSAWAKSSKFRDYPFSSAHAKIAKLIG